MCRLAFAQDGPEVSALFAIIMSPKFLILVLISFLYLVAPSFCQDSNTNKILYARPGFYGQRQSGYNEYFREKPRDK
ncbi:hypothetical protein SFRURICE_018520 [Spodoptera frugiperda]|nr:hypothetical protein SFRURICE_018520 [Spodoptera frugiperda]